MTNEDRKNNAEAYAQNVANDPTQQAVAARTAAYQEYAAIHGRPPIVEPSGIVLRQPETVNYSAEYRTHEA